MQFVPAADSALAVLLDTPNCTAGHAGQYDVTELVCGSCAAAAAGADCPRHGTTYIEYKCRSVHMILHVHFETCPATMCGCTVNASATLPIDHPLYNTLCPLQFSHQSPDLNLHLPSIHSCLLSTCPCCCRYCCSVASWYCWGTTHMCDPCHGDTTRRRVMSAAPCDGPSRQVTHCTSPA